MIPSRQHVIVISALLLSTISAQFVSPNPISGCNGGVDAGIVTCSNQGGCCSGGAACCAGGCCPTTAWCVNEGLPNEGCCDLNDPTWCQGSKGVPPLFVRLAFNLNLVYVAKNRHSPKRKYLRAQQLLALNPNLRYNAPRKMTSGAARRGPCVALTLLSATTFTYRHVNLWK
jgi:hypothetical protein